MGPWFGMLVNVYALPLLVYVAFALPALYFLRQRDIDETSRALWVLAILAVPVMGAVAFAVVKPGTRT